MLNTDATKQNPPNSKESEMMVLGCMLTNINALNVACDSLNDTDFYYMEHKLVYQVLKSAYKQDRSIDIHLASEELKSQGKLKAVGGVLYLTTLAQYAGTSAYIEEYCKILRDRSLSRQAISIIDKAINELLNDLETPSKTIEKLHQQIIELGKRYSPNDKASIGEILTGNKSRIEPTPIIERLKSRQDFHKEHGKPFLTGLPTGFADLDQKVTILEDTNLVVVAGRPAMGKTAFTMNILSNICFNQNLPVGFISLEMGADQLVERILSLRTGIAGEKIKRGTFDETEYRKLIEEVSQRIKSKFFIHDQAISTVSQVVSRARKLKDEEDIRILAIDYLQLLGTDAGNDSRQYEVAEVSRTLKRLSMELKIPIIAVSQLSRKVEERNSKRPFMSDLRDSGQIEQDADAIMFVYREEYYDPNSKKGQAEIILSKNRHGPTVNVSLSFRSDCGAFSNLASINRNLNFNE